MILAHISASPGAGKTTLGEYIQHLFPYDNVIIKDTDDFLSRKSHNYIFATRSLHKRINRWRETYIRNIEKFIKKNKNKYIVFVGILNFGSPSPDDLFYELDA